MEQVQVQHDEVDDIFPFYFPTVGEREVPLPIAQRWSHHSHYFFFYNGLINRSAIRRFLSCQSLARLEQIAACFDLEAIDLVAEKRKKEGVVLSQEDSALIVEAILSSVTV